MDLDPQYVLRERRLQPATNTGPISRLVIPPTESEGAPHREVLMLRRTIHPDLDYVLDETLRFCPATNARPVESGGNRNPRFEVERRCHQAGNGLHAGMTELEAESFAHPDRPESATIPTIDAFPTRPLEAVDRLEDCNLICKICLGSRGIGNSVMELPCGHWFDRDCDRTWLREHSTCRTCRLRFDSSQA